MIIRLHWFVLLLIFLMLYPNHRQPQRQYWRYAKSVEISRRTLFVLREILFVCCFSNFCLRYRGFSAPTPSQTKYDPKKITEQKVAHSAFGFKITPGGVVVYWAKFPLSKPLQNTYSNLKRELPIDGSALARWVLEIEQF